MKRMKRLASLLMALVMALTLAVPAMAVKGGTPDTDGSITINKVHSGITYTVYRMLDLESYDTDLGAYSYKVNSAWTSFFAAGTGALDYVAIDEAGYVTWKTDENEATKAAFAKLALAYAKNNNIRYEQSSEVGDMNLSSNGDNTQKGVFENLPLGYYLVDSTVGALCGLTTTKPNASVNVKNGIPTVTKKVEEDSTGQYLDQNTADIGQTVNFRTTITVQAGAENYVLHDVMSNGLTFQNITRIEHVVPGSDTHEVNGTKYTLYTKCTEESHETCKHDITDDCTFEIHFSKQFCEELKANDYIVIYYSAMLNRNAIVAGAGNPNETWLDYGEDNESNTSETKTYTYGFDLVKTNENDVLIDGAKFRIYDAATGGNEVAVVAYDGATSGVDYRKARVDEFEDRVDIEVKDGKVRVIGLDNGTYYLEEIEAPEGYNKMTARQEFIISDDSLDAIFDEGGYSAGSGVHVVNHTGNLLPETGGMGTTLFYVLGGVLVIGAGVALVTKKRMG